MDLAAPPDVIVAPSVGLLSVAPSGRSAGWRRRRLIRPTVWCRL
ncbi:hypothetical protein HMPREF3207_01918 [Citrobacter koseri]|nr:hypothetical protein HMPREF3207_01918 [Citrobacter koseri]